MFRSKYKLFLSVFLMFMLVFSCKKDTPTFQFHYDYFDLTEGRYIEYRVKEIRHDAGASIQHDTLNYLLRTVIGDTIIDNEGRTARKFYRYKRNNTSENWVLSDLWMAIISENRAELIEENQRIIKLVFKPSITKEWNANAFNTYPELNCYYEDLHLEGTFNGFSFDSTLRVEQENFFSLVDYRRKHETYAKGVGLVSKYYKNLTIQNFDTLNVTNGEELFYTLIGYGFE